MAKCSSCLASIDWVRTKLGRAMPLDPTYLEIAPDPIGETVVVTDAGEVVRGRLAHGPGTLVRGARVTSPRAPGPRRDR